MINKIITLTSVSKNNDGQNLKVRVFVDSIGQYWVNDNGVTCVRYRDGGIFGYVETPEQIDNLIMGGL